MLNSHPHISVSPEGLFELNLKNKYGKAVWTKDTIKHFYEDLWLESRLSNWNLIKNNLISDLMKFDLRWSYADFCRVVYRGYAKSQKKSETILFGIKNPLYSLFIKDLINIFPGAKFIHLVRDPRDTIISYQKVPFDSSVTSTLAYRWKYYNQTILKQLKKHSIKPITLNYERLVTDPENKLKRICQFLNIEYDSQMLKFDENINMQTGDWHGNLTGQVKTNRLFVWKKSMEKKDIDCTNYICQDLTERFGYDISSKNYSITTTLLIIPGIIFGWVTIFLEKLLFYYLPLDIRSILLRYYRIFTNSIDKE